MSREIAIGPYSAYAIAVKYGYTGTEQQWIAEQEASRLAAAQSAAVTAVTDTKTAATKAVQAAQDTATKAVSAAQTAATAAVEKKGKDVLATIPEDYSDTVARVSALESCGFVVVDGKVCMKYVKS